VKEFSRVEVMEFREFGTQVSDVLWMKCTSTVRLCCIWSCCSGDVYWEMSAWVIWS